ncbi:Vacuolar protein sorting-associated protein 13A [Cichlidogyrus casuarinus]|uniref:Vacuolar protein sorting-associated protein 13A n=1 Tax=Cichlidogyrus casuarinus TaxID=1844966 RepID=A0ABD2QL43_9PLAT
MTCLEQMTIKMQEVMFLDAKTKLDDVQACVVTDRSRNLLGIQNEHPHGSDWLSVQCNTAAPFWPRNPNLNSGKVKHILVRFQLTVDDLDIVTPLIPIDYSKHISLRFPDFHNVLSIDVQNNDDSCILVLEEIACNKLFQIVNCLHKETVSFYQEKVIELKMTLTPNEFAYYAWDSAIAKPMLTVLLNQPPKQKEVQVDLCKDGQGQIKLSSDRVFYWVCYVYKMRRVLLFTEDSNLAQYARLSVELEPLSMDFIFSLHSVGVSIVDHAAREELLYISLHSSGVRWSKVKKFALKPLAPSVNDAIEMHYKNYMDDLTNASANATLSSHIVTIPKSDKHAELVIDFLKMVLISDGNQNIHRAFEPGFYFAYRTSPSQFTIDDQVTMSSHPVIFSPYLDTGYKALDKATKPFIELSAVISTWTNLYRFRYFHVLLQEIQLKLTQAFIVRLMNFFSTLAVLDPVTEEQLFANSIRKIEQPLTELDFVSLNLSTGDIKCLLDDLLISPIKIHFGISLLANDYSQGNLSEGSNSHVSLEQQGTNHLVPTNVTTWESRENVVSSKSRYLIPFSTALTDVNDVILKLGYFERRNQIMKLNQLTDNLGRHYMNQGLKQLYVLVFGLDVLGNPFGVLRGFAQGFEDLFYEPAMGAIEGPGEFIEGMGSGIKSLLCHTVGGAMGAASLISGTIGKGLAAVTLDDEYKQDRMRKLQQARQSSKVAKGFAQGGMAFVSGVYHGVTGVVTQPIQGLRKEGATGLFKGIGKGLIGVVARPISGTVDSISTTFEGFKR